MLPSRSLQEKFRLDGEQYWRSGRAPIEIEPIDEPVIRINGVAVSQKSLKSTQSVGARFLVVTDESGVPVAKVVEHLLSAVHGSGIRGVSIKTPLWVPVIGAGIDGVYTELMRNSRESMNETPYPAYIYSPHEFRSSDGTCTLVVSPSDTLNLIIERISDPELGVDAHIRFPDLYNTMENSQSARQARPIARVRNHVINTIQRLVEIQGGKGVSTTNYIFNRPNFSQTDIVGQMQAEFQRSQNEHLAHTGIADFFGELHTFFPSGLIGKLHFKGKNNHTTRLELLLKLQLAYLYG